jgi:cell division transport system ATP-binding protein
LSDLRRRRLVGAVLEVRPEPEMRLVLLGMDVESIGAAGRAALRDRIGFLASDGGLLSSLNAWENIVLPLGFHRPRRLPCAEAEIRDALAGLGADAKTLLAKLPEKMTPYEKNLTGYVRILLEKPDLVLAEEPKGEVDPAERAAAAKFADVYLERCPGGTYVQLESVTGS